MKSLKLSPERKEALAKLTGIVVAVFAVFTLISILSYLFNWKAAMASQTAGKAAGSLGQRFGSFLVGDCFGLGSLALLVILTAVSLRLIFHRWKQSLLKTTLMTLLDAFIASLLLSYISSLTGIRTLFGGGLGGRCGLYVADWACSVMGIPVTGLVFLLLAFIAAMLSSDRFVHWLGTVGTERQGSGYVERDSVELNLSKEGVIPVPDEKAVKAVPDKPLPQDQPSSKEEEMQSEKPSEEVTMTVIEGEGLKTDIRKPLPRIDNRLDPPYGLPKYKFPSLDLLDTYENGKHTMSSDELNRNKNQIIAALKNFKIEISDIRAVVGPTVTLYKVIPAPGVKIASIQNLHNDIAMFLNATGVRASSFKTPSG